MGKIQLHHIFFSGYSPLTLVLGSKFLRESNATTALTGDGAQAVMQARGAAVNTVTLHSLTCHSPPAVPQFLTGHGPVAVRAQGVGDFSLTCYRMLLQMGWPFPLLLLNVFRETTCSQPWPPTSHLFKTPVSCFNSQMGDREGHDGLLRLNYSQSKMRKEMPLQDLFEMSQDRSLTPSCLK